MQRQAKHRHKFHVYHRKHCGWIYYVYGGITVYHTQCWYYLQTAAQSYTRSNVNADGHYEVNQNICCGWEFF